MFTGKILRKSRKVSIVLGLVTYYPILLVSFSLVIARLLAWRGNKMYVLLKRLQQYYNQDTLTRTSLCSSEYRYKFVPIIHACYVPGIYAYIIYDISHVYLYIQLLYQKIYYAYIHIYSQYIHSDILALDINWSGYILQIITIHILIWIFSPNIIHPKIYSKHLLWIINQWSAINYASY